MKKLTKAQTDTLVVLYATEDWRGSYPGLSLGTLAALMRRGLAMARHEPGSMAFPSTSIKWRITPAGRAALTDSVQP